MTQEQFEVKFDDMLKRAEKTIREKGCALFRSGAIDPAKYEDDFILPRIILVVALEHGIDQVRPLHNQHRKEIANLRHF